MPGCSQLRPLATAPTAQACPTCAPTASCSAHRHRPHAAPCPDPDKCYASTRSKREKCPSAASVVKLDGTRCACAEVQARATRSLSRRRVRSPKAVVDTGLRRGRTHSRRKPFCVIL